MDLKELLDRCRQKDHKAWNIFTRRYKGLVCRSVRYKINKLGVKIGRDEFRDIVQEIFLSLWEREKLNKVTRVNSFEGWLAVISINHTHNYCRENVFGSRDVVFSQIVTNSENECLESFFLCGQSDAWKTIEGKDIKNLIEQEINKLPIRQRLAIRLNYIEDLKYKDISEIMNIPTNTVSTLIRRAKLNMKKAVSVHIENYEGGI